ncbi:MAG: DUF2461 domain-containing protein [Bacteroidales bacterium]|nr:DUF2461 domain-containing protein [Bacteroidales bacterium]
MKAKIILDFLSELKENNNRDWFQANKAKYEEAKESMLFLLQNLLEELSAFDKDLGALDAKQCLFRIYRDVRFSMNKQPYKNNMGGFIAVGGRKGGNAGYYLHIEPGNSFVGGGLYRPEPKILKAVRDEINYTGQEFISIIENKDFKHYFPELLGESLVRPPKGYDPDSAFIELLKMKSFTVLKSLDDTDLLQDNLIEYLMPIFKKMQPFNAYLNKAISH